MKGLSAHLQRTLKNDKLKGVQRNLLHNTPLAYRVQTSNGTLVLCDKHIDQLRKTETATLTGETFNMAECDHCHPEAA